METEEMKKGISLSRTYPGATLDPQDLFSEAYQTMLASERVLRRGASDQLT
jgi:hypothetical protein